MSDTSPGSRPPDRQQPVQSPTRIPRRVLEALFQSLAAGVAPRLGVEHIVVGRGAEIRALLHDLETIKDGGGSFRILSGVYGSGKSFLLHLMRTYATQQGYVVIDADLSPDRALTGSTGKGLASYREAMASMATRTQEGAGALRGLLDRWLQQVRSEAQAEAGEGGDASEGIERRVQALVRTLQDEKGGYNVAAVLQAYYRGWLRDDPERQAAAIRSLRGEFPTKTEARRALGITGLDIVQDSDWYDYVKVLARFVHLAGYEGLLLVLDEAVNLYKINHKTSRANQYEKLLEMLNDVLQGKTRHLGILVGATPELLEHPVRGLFNYEALEGRLRTSQFSVEGARDMTAPVLHLDALSNQEVFALLRRVRELHAYRYGYDAGRVSDEDLTKFMEATLHRLGAERFINPRSILIDCVTILNVIEQHEGRTFLGVLNSEEFTPARDDTAERIQQEAKAGPELEGEEPGGDEYEELDL